MLVVGIATGLYAGQTDTGRGFIASLSSTQAELAAAQPAQPAPPPPAAPTPAAAITPCPPAPAPVAVAAAPAPAPQPPAVPVLAVATSVPAAPAPAAAVAAPKPRPQREGTLRIRSTPTCDIVVDGHKTGLRTPQRSLELEPGKHSITLVNKKQKIRSTFSVRIKDGKTTRVTKHLRRSKKR
ncbi:MAG TPA: PEGA domain-containing protein [Kofleriaceae bacterium]|nr:PEGA domain-containing protein [Kofleriaceae bacterium]